MIGKGKSEAIIIGGDSRVDLLPPEVRGKREAQVVRRRLVFVVLLFAVFVVGVSALVHAQAHQAQVNLSLEQANTQSLLLQQQKYVVVQKIQKETATIQAAQQVGTSTEIDWEKYLTSVQATLPPDVTIDTISIDSATPFSPYTQPSAPLQGARIATLSFTARSSTLPRVPTWLIALTSLPGYADASPGSVTRNESGAYSVSITMHINQAAFTNRFATVRN